jgi:hypothetical protein
MSSNVLVTTSLHLPLRLQQRKAFPMTDDGWPGNLKSTFVSSGQHKNVLTYLRYSTH